MKSEKYYIVKSNGYGYYKGQIIIDGKIIDITGNMRSLQYVIHYCKKYLAYQSYIPRRS